MATSKAAVLESEFGVAVEVSGSGRQWTARAARDGEPIDEATGTSRAQALEVLGNGLAAWALNGHPTLAEVKAGRPACACGCGELTKGGTYRPGHDARHHSALRKAGLPLPPRVTRAPVNPRPTAPEPPAPAASRPGRRSRPVVKEEAR